MSESHLKVGGKVVKPDEIPGSITLGRATLGYGPGHEFRTLADAVSEFARVYGITEVDVRKSSVVTPDISAVLPKGFDTTDAPLPDVKKEVIRTRFPDSWLDPEKIEIPDSDYGRTVRIRLSLFKELINNLESYGVDLDSAYIQVEARIFEGNPEMDFPELYQVRKETDEEAAARARELQLREIRERERKYREFLRLKAELGI